MAIQPEQESQPKSGVSTVITKMGHNSHLHVYDIQFSEYYLDWYDLRD